LASQAGISLEHAQLYADLQQENIERNRAEGELRRSGASLREAQSLFGVMTSENGVIICSEPDVRSKGSEMDSPTY
jgi:hypothetical protein